MAFAGATDDIFQLLKDKFPNCVQKEISISFRVPQEIADVANDFTRKFMTRRKPKLATNKTNGGKKPVVFLASSEQDYQLTEEEEKRLLDEERAETGLTEEEVYEFTRQIDKQLIERNIENAGKNRLSSIHKAKVTKTQNPTHQHSNPTPSIAEIIGDEGEKKAFELLANNKKINEAFYYSPTENFHRQQEIWKQQIIHQEKIAEDFNSAKPIVYLVSFPTGELAHDFRVFLNQKENVELLVVHHDKVHTKTWKVEYNILRIDELIGEKEKEITKL
ncbi:17324_t:CDS:2 [Cetraspora pellucida]|uniref:17324_t:CDS:1 n=1 Tax=Cetraspora pellucida TaxID=1433469 RepID=A0ACA9K5V7_9GLOM|nr:17324_t:CDS:2 [Cetraspora pellucida]